MPLKIAFTVLKLLKSKHSCLGDALKIPIIVKLRPFPDLP